MLLIFCNQKLFVMRFPRGKVLIEYSAFCGFIRYNFLFVFAPQGRLFPTKWKQFSQAKTPEKVRPERGTLSPSQGILPLPAPTGGEGRGGRERFPRGMGTDAETPTKAEMGKLKRNVCKAESVCLLFRVPRADCIVGNDCAALARVGNESFTPGARVEFRGSYYFSARGAGERSSIGKRKIRAENVTQNITRLHPREPGTGVSASMARGDYFV